MTVDTTVTNGRFVNPEVVVEGSISIHHGIVLDGVEFEDVWRTVDASGHLVLPGMIQPGSPTSSDSLQLAQRGSTVVLQPYSYQDSRAPLASPIDLLHCMDLDHVDRATDLSRLISSGYRVFSTCAPRPDLSQALTGAILRVGAERDSQLTSSLGDWVDLDSNKLVVPATHPEALALARKQHAMLEVPVSTLTGGDAPDIWDLVADADMPVHVTNGGDGDFPLLPFLHHEGHEVRSISLSRIAAVTSTIPAQWYGLFPYKGTFRPGSHGDIVVFDPETPDPYRDSQWPGRVILSIQRGNILLYNGQLHTSPVDGLALGD